MKRAIQMLAIVLALASVALWLAMGANTGWTKNRVQVRTLDPVTELEQVEWQDKFVPGLELLGGGLAVAGVLFIGSFFVRKQTKTQTS